LLAAIIVGVVIVAAVAWAATIGRPNGRAVAILILGTVAVTLRRRSWPLPAQLADTV
jgi:hypothetical protein